MKRLLILCVAILFLSACGGGDNTSSNWKVGTQGVTMTFSPNAPPADLYAGEEYPIVLELRNKGAYPGDDDELDVDLYFSGFDRNLIDLRDDDYTSIEGSISQTNREGGMAFYEDEFDVFLYEDADSLPQDIRVTACYYYETLAPLDVCIDPNPIQNDEDTCTPGPIGGTGGQAAPIAISSVTQDSLKGKVRFTIKITNPGGGSVYRDNDCLNPSPGDKEIVEILDVYIGEDEMDCTPSEYVRLVNGVGTLTCTYDRLDEDQPSYKTSLGVQLGYNYKDSIVKQVTIKRIE